MLTHTHTHMQVHVRTHSLWPPLCRESVGVACWVRLNEMIITLQLAHVTEPCRVPLPCSNADIYWQRHWSLYANLHCGWISVCGCVCVSICCLCEFCTLIRDTCLPPCSIIAITHIFFVSQYKFNGLDCILSSAESGDTYQRQVLSIFSIASGICLLGVACMALYRRNKWVMPASTTLVEYAPGCAERALYYHGVVPNEILSVSQWEDVLAGRQIWIVQDAFGTDTHVRFIYKVVLASRCFTKCLCTDKNH